MKQTTTKIEIVPDTGHEETALAVCAASINSSIDEIVEHEQNFELATLEPRVRMGRELARAQGIFGMTSAEGGRLGGRPKIPRDRGHEVTRLTGEGFSGWAAREVPRLNLRSAYRYIGAWRALGLPDDASDAALRKRIAKFSAGYEMEGKRISVRALSTAWTYERKRAEAGIPVSEKIRRPHSSPELKLGDARESWRTWIEQAENLVKSGVLDDLDEDGWEEIMEHLAWLGERVSARLNK